MNIDRKKILTLIDEKCPGEQKIFAKKAKISQSMLTRILSGETKKPRIKNLEKICEALECDLKEILIIDNREDNMVKNTHAGDESREGQVRPIRLMCRIAAGGDKIGWSGKMQAIQEFLWSKTSCALLVQDNAMSPVYEEGDHVLMDRRPDITLADAENRMCTIDINDKTYLRIVRIDWDGNKPKKIRLEPKNPKYEIIELQPDDKYFIGSYEVGLVWRAGKKYY